MFVVALQKINPLCDQTLTNIVSDPAILVSLGPTSSVVKCFQTRHAGGDQAAAAGAGRGGGRRQLELWGAREGTDGAGKAMFTIIGRITYFRG